MQLELVVVAIGVPLRLREAKWSLSIAVIAIRNTGSELSDRQEVMWLDAEEDALPDAFLCKQRTIDCHWSHRSLAAGFRRRRIPASRS